MKKALFLLLLLTSPLTAQVIDCRFVVNADLVNQTNQQVFETLEQALNEFINAKAWTDETVDNKEKVRCSMVLNLTGFNGLRFEGTLQVQVERPVYQTNYNSPLFNFLDKDIVFSYQEYQPLFYNSASYESNLISLISFYVFVALGVEADSFALRSGTPYFKQAQQIVTLAQQNGIAGWNQRDGNRNRFWLIDTMLSNTFREYRTVQYHYHRDGMDQMTENPKAAKEAIMQSLGRFNALYNRRPNALLIQTFFDAKADEIVDLFSDGPKVEFSSTFTTLNKVAPFFGPKWKRIKY